MRVERCFAFIDLSGFTAFTEHHGDERTVAVLTAFRGRVREIAARRGVRVTKWLGDGAMLSSADTSAVVAMVVELADRIPESVPLGIRAGLANGPVAAALRALGLSERQAGELAGDRELLSAPAGMAAEVYAGVLYDALDLPGLRRRGVATDHVLISSGLWGVLRPGDRIPRYRCPAGVKLPGVGPVSAAWRKALRAPLAAHVGDRLVVDLRSGAYASMWAPGGNAVTVRVLHERWSRGTVTRSVVSHFNKATKGRLTRALLESGQQPGKPEEFTDLARALGYTVEPGPGASRPDAPAALDLVVREL